MSKVYLNVPYYEKDEVKALGGRWDASEKKWYFNGDTKYLYKFKAWMSKADILAYDEIYIIEGHRKCHHCHQTTTVVGIGISLHSNIYLEDEKYIVEHYLDEDEKTFDDTIHLAWFDKEDDVPPYLLNILKSKYNVKSVFSKTQNEITFANCCEHCGALQGNYFLFSECSPLTTDAEGQELINRMEQLTIYTINTDYALPLKIDLSYCDNDWAYREYCHFDYSDNDYVSYGDMYNDSKPKK